MHWAWRWQIKPLKTCKTRMYIPGRKTWQLQLLNPPAVNATDVEENTIHHCCFKTEMCHHCGKRGHIARMCHTRLKQHSPTQLKQRSRHQHDAHKVTATDTELPHQTENTEASPPVHATIRLKRKATVSHREHKLHWCRHKDQHWCLSLHQSEQVYRLSWPNHKQLQPSTALLHTYTGVNECLWLY